MREQLFKDQPVFECFPGLCQTEKIYNTMAAHKTGGQSARKKVQVYFLIVKLNIVAFILHSNNN